MRILIFRCFRFLLVVLLGLLSGCWLTQHESIGANSDPAELLHKGVYGSRTLYDASASWVTNPIALENTYAALNKRQLKDAVVLPNIDFEKYGVLFLEMGQRPTGGYTIDFSPSLSRVIDKQAIIKISWNMPQEGLLLTQAVTSPFILIKVDRANITSIIVVDQNEKLLFEIAIR